MSRELCRELRGELCRELRGELCGELRRAGGSTAEKEEATRKRCLENVGSSNSYIELRTPNLDGTCNGTSSVV